MSRPAEVTRYDYGDAVRDLARRRGADGWTWPKAWASCRMRYFNAARETGAEAACREAWNAGRAEAGLLPVVLT